MAEDHNAQGPATGITPHLTIPSRGGQAAIEFYTRAFGATEVRRMLGQARVALAADQQWVQQRRLKLAEADALLNNAFADLLKR